jgi:hypothetical protein
MSNKEMDVNAFDLITFALMIALSYCSGRFFGSYFGPVGWIAGILVGGSLPPLGRHLIGHILERWFPRRPPCKNGKCLAPDYEMVEIRQLKDRFALAWRCKCGTMYLQKFPRFQELLPDGSVVPYMKRTRGKWKPDIPTTS